MRYCKHIVRGRCLLFCIFFCTALTVLLYFWHAKTQTAFHSMYVMKLIAVTLLLCNSGRRKPTSPTTENGWLSRAMISIILALMDLAFELSRWNVLTLSNYCFTCWLFDPHSRHCDLNSECCVAQRFTWHHDVMYLRYIGMHVSVDIGFSHRR